MSRVCFCRWQQQRVSQSDAFVRAQFARIRSGTSVSGFQKYKGGQEPSFEALGMALGRRNYNKFYIDNVKSECVHQ